MPAPFVIAWKDLRQRFRDRSALVIAFLAPLAVAAVMSLAFQATQNVHATIGVVDLDHGPVARAFVEAIDAPDLHTILTARTLGDETTARDEVRRATLGAAIVIPPGFSAAALGPHPEAVVTVTNVNAPVPAGIAESVAVSFAAQLNADRLSVATAAHGAGAAETARLAAAVASWSIPVESVARSVNAHPLKTISYYAPAMAIFFVMFMISFTARSFFVERDQGMLERMLAAPLRPRSILAGKALSVFVYGTASLVTVWAVTTLAFGADWGAPLPSLVVSLAMVLAVVCLTALVIVISRTQRQAEGFASIVIFGLVLVGGNFVFISIESPVLQRLALLTPNGWALRAYTDLSTTGGGISVVVEPLIAILAFCAVVGTVAALLAPRAFER